MPSLPPPLRFSGTVINLRRRHLDESRRAIVTARIATLPKGQHTSIRSTHPRRCGRTLNVSRSGVRRARTDFETWQLELIAAVERGDIAVSTAAHHHVMGDAYILAGTPFDFTSPRLIGERIRDAHAQLRSGVATTAISACAAARPALPHAWNIRLPAA